MRPEPADVEGGPSDGSLAGAAAQGDRAAFGRLVGRHAGWVRNMLLAALGNDADAQDAAQEAFARAWANLAGLQEPEAFRGWLRSIAQRAGTDLGRRKTVPVRTLPPEPADAGGPSPSEAEERRVAVARAVEALSEPCREAVALRYDLGLSCRQIAQRLSLDVGAVTMRLSRAHRELAKSLASWGIEP